MISMSGKAWDRNVDAREDGIDEMPFVGALFATIAEGIATRGNSVDEIAGDDKSGGVWDERRESFRFKVEEGGFGGWFEVRDVKVRDLEEQDWTMEMSWQ